MLDLRTLRNDPQSVRASQTARGEDAGLVDQVLAADQRRREAVRAFDTLRAEQKQLGRQVAAASGPEKAELLQRAKELASAVKDAEASQVTAEEQLRTLAMELSNVVEDGVPVGGEDAYRVLEEVGTPRDFAAEGFAPRDHLELGERLGAIDVQRGAKVSGARFYYLTGPGALLELALINCAVRHALRHGFVPVYPPVLVKPRAMEGTGFLGQAAENVFRLEADDFYLVGTSEVALAAMHTDEILDVGRLPLRYAGLSSCFRREAGSYGRDTRGIWRVHQFDKVEMFSFCTPQDARAEHRRLLDWEKEFFTELGIPFRVIDVASGDLGSSATRKFDIEAWIPTRGGYGEVTSTSNCTTFQARRLNIRMRDGDQLRPVATLNGTLVAVSRAIVAILENHQQVDGSVVVPESLRATVGTDVLRPTS